MTTATAGRPTAGPPSRRGGITRTPSVTANVVGVALAVCGAGLVASGFVDLLEHGRDTIVLAVMGLLCVAGGAGLRRSVPMPAQVAPHDALRSVMVAAGTMIGVSSVVYLATGTITRVDEAVFESTAGFTTTALTVLADVESVDLGVLFWRSLTQWLGGFLGLATIVAVLPFLGVGGPRPAGAAAPVGAKHLFSPHVGRLLRRYLSLYVGLTAIGATLFLAGGMGPLDATTYAFTTISGGGFANHEESFAYFDSALLEWFGVAGMLLAGLSLPIAWRALRGRRLTTFRSVELVTYAGIVATSTAILSLTVDGDGLHDTVRTAAFSASSAASTTGHWVADWSAWAPGPQMLMLVVMGVGAMSGALGGGFRILRALALFGYIRSELDRQLAPRRVTLTRVGGTVIDAQTADRMLGYQVLFIGVATAGFAALALSGADLLTSLSGSVSALATVGPALGELAPGAPLSAVSHWVLVALMGLMLAGRIELYPLLDLVLGALTAPSRARRALARRRHGIGAARGAP